VGKVPPAPPSAREEVVDAWHGDRVADPYRWLEGSSDRIRTWTDAQNQRTRAVLDGVPARAAFASRLRELLSVGLLTTPRPHGKWIFHTRREGSQKQAVLYVREGVSGKDRALVDPNTMDAQGLVTLDWYYPSADGNLVAYGLSHGGDELSTLHAIATRSTTDCGEAIPFTQRSSVAWADNEGFFYTVHPEPGSVPPGDEHYHRRVRFHRVGDEPSRDELVFGEGRPKEDILVIQTSPDGRWLLAMAFRGWAQSDLFLLDRRDGAKKWRTVIAGEAGLTTGLLTNDSVWLRTNVGAPNYTIVRAPLSSPERASWKTVVPETEQSIELFDVSRDSVAVVRLESATSRISLWSHDGKHQRDVPLPGLGTVPGISADPTGDLIAFTFESFTSPPAAYVIDGDAVRELVKLTPPPRLDPDDFDVEQTTYASKDGTTVTMFLVHRKDVIANGDVPTILSGYGGFNISRTPQYFPGVAAWVEAGGLFALPNLRGGGEYGERWHRDGMLERKQNVFDDFHAAAEALVAQGWTKVRRLGVSGGSNGGLLTGAALTQRPELFGAVFCAVPLLDMLRYQNFLIARFWIAEYGSAEDPAQYRWLRAYSPYHHVRDGVRYPAVLFTTAEGDSRVDPMHARKMAALMQAVTAEDPDAVVLLRVERDAGHGVGKPLDKQVEDLADQYSFFSWRLGLDPKPSGMLEIR